MLFFFFRKLHFRLLKTPWITYCTISRFPIGFLYDNRKKLAITREILQFYSCWLFPNVSKGEIRFSIFLIIASLRIKFPIAMIYHTFWYIHQINLYPVPSKLPICYSKTWFIVQILCKTIYTLFFDTLSIFVIPIL